MFKPASKVKKHLKIVVYGESGVGKTQFSLEAPGKKAVIDTESGTDFFVNDYQFDLRKTRLYSDVIEELDYIERHPKKYDVLIIDPITNIYQTMKDTAWRVVEQRARKYGKDVETVNLTQRDWGSIKQKFGSLITRLGNLPCHVIMTGWQKDIYDEQTMKKIGAKIDADKKIQHHPDVLIRLELDQQGTTYGVIEKDRTRTFKRGERVKEIAFRHFLKAVSSDGHASYMMTEIEAAEAESPISGETMLEIQQAWNDAGLSSSDLNPTLYKYFHTTLDQLTEYQAKEVLKKIPAWSQQSASVLGQQRRIYILGKQLGMDRNEVQKFVSTMLGSAVTSLKQLSYQQAEACIKDLEDEIQVLEQEKESS